MTGCYTKNATNKHELVIRAELSTLAIFISGIDGLPTKLLKIY